MRAVLWLALGVPLSLTPSCPDQPCSAPPLHVLVQRRAEALEITPETVAAILELAQREQAARARRLEALQQAHSTLRSAMEAERPRRAEVMAAAEGVGAAEQALRRHHLHTALEIRALLTPKQWTALRPSHPPPPPHRCL